MEGARKRKTGIGMEKSVFGIVVVFVVAV